MEQRDLFASPPAQRHSRTSLAAAGEIAGSASSLRRQVYEFIRGCGEEGATDEEIALALELNPSTARPRRIELQQGGLVADSGRTRKTQANRAAVVWVVTR